MEGGRKRELDGGGREEGEVWLVVEEGRWRKEGRGGWKKEKDGGERMEEPGGGWREGRGWSHHVSSHQPSQIVISSSSWES